MKVSLLVLHEGFISGNNWWKLNMRNRSTYWRYFSQNLCSHFFLYTLSWLDSNFTHIYISKDRIDIQIVAFCWNTYCVLQPRNENYLYFYTHQCICFSIQNYCRHQITNRQLQLNVKHFMALEIDVLEVFALTICGLYINLWLLAKSPYNQHVSPLCLTITCNTTIENDHYYTMSVYNSSVQMTHMIHTRRSLVHIMDYWLAGANFLIFCCKLRNKFTWIYLNLK